MYEKIKIFGSKVGAVGAGLLATVGPALADLAADAQTAIDAAKGDATTVGGYVVGAVAVIVGVGLVLALIRKV